MSPSKKIHIERGIAKWELITYITSFTIAMFAISFVLIAYTPIRTLIPGYPDAMMRQQQVENTLRIDSLEQCIARWQLYTNNLQAVIAGGKPVTIDQILKKSENEKPAISNDALAKTDSTVRSIAEENQMKKNKVAKDEIMHIEGMHFDKPMTGTLTKQFDNSFSPYIQITAPEGTMVKSVLDGTVIYAGWTEFDGWGLVIQHGADIVSIYSHCSKALVKVGDKVKAGTAIGLLGKSGADTSEGANLHFELWQDGKALDPAIFINF